jgi:hypothetical protein
MGDIHSLWNENFRDSELKKERVFSNPFSHSFSNFNF